MSKNGNEDDDGDGDGEGDGIPTRPWSSLLTYCSKHSEREIEGEAEGERSIKQKIGVHEEMK